MSPLSWRTNSIGYGASMIVGMPFGTQFAVGLSVLRSNSRELRARSRRQRIRR